MLNSRKLAIIGEADLVCVYHQYVTHPNVTERVSNYIRTRRGLKLCTYVSTLGLVSLHSIANAVPKRE